MDHHHRRQRQGSPRGNAPVPGGGSGGVASSGRQKGGGGKGGGKKPIKVVYISNPMRVKTSAARFRSLVQELTGRHADPSKYSPDDLVAAGGAAGADDDAAADIDGAAQGLSPWDAVASSDTVVASPSAAADHQPDATGSAPRGGYYDEDDDDVFRSQLLENNYAVFSPPTLLYDHHPPMRPQDTSRRSGGDATNDANEEAELSRSDNGGPNFHWLAMRFSARHIYDHHGSNPLARRISSASARLYDKLRLILYQKTRVRSSGQESIEMRGNSAVVSKNSSQSSIDNLCRVLCTQQNSNSIRIPHRVTMFIIRSYQVVVVFIPLPSAHQK
ncbi:hypothetical protein EJB05_18498, partial [Eragrostis curvula]